MYYSRDWKKLERVLYAEIHFADKKKGPQLYMLPPRL